MSKVVCEICGTSYPETCDQCPICGCVKPIDSGVVLDKDSGSGSHYTYVKGGRFSKKNVRKINGGSIQSVDRMPTLNDQKNENRTRKNRIILISAIALLLVVLAVCAYLFIDVYSDFLFSDSDGTQNTTVLENEETEDTATEDTASTESTDSDQVTVIACTAINGLPENVVFDSEQNQLQLEVVCIPANTTDIVIFESANPEIITVDETGLLTAVSEGETTITVTCGAVKNVFSVTYTMPKEEIPVTKFELNRTDFTLFYAGDYWYIYDGDIPAREIVWTSDNEEVVIVEFGRVVAVGEGTTYIHGEYDGEKHSCIVRVVFKDYN